MKRILIAISLFIILLGITGCEENNVKATVITQTPVTITAPKKPIPVGLGESLTIPLKAGDRVLIEVNIERNPNYEEPNIGLDAFTRFMFYSGTPTARIKDPFGNTIAQTATETAEYQGTFKIRGIQEYPWQFAFIAAINGDYLLEIGHGEAFLPADLKAIINP